MLRVSILAVAAVMLAACDDAEDTVAVEGEVTEPEVAAEQPAAEPEAQAEAEPEAEAEVVTAEEAEPEAEVAAEEEAQPEIAAEEAEPEAEVAAAEEAGPEGQQEDTTVLTPESEAVESRIISEEDVQEVEVTEEGTATGEQAAMAREGDLSEAMESYQDWAVGRWATDASCETNVVELQENAMTLPGGVNCEEVRVSGAGQDSLDVTGMSCQGAEGVDQVEIEVTQAGGGLQVSRDGQQTELTRCQ